MDWNKTKTIFIIVFSILNVFLYWMYVNKYNEGKNVELIGETDTLTRLKDENITVKSEQIEGLNVSYISGKIKKFTQDELLGLTNQRIQLNEDGTKLEAKILNPTPLAEITDESLTDFVTKNIYKGSSYMLWKIDRKNNEAIFFQSTENSMIYYNQNAEIKIYWNDHLEITGYEQKMFDSLKSFGEKSPLYSTKQAIKQILDKGYLLPNSTITKTQLGYSTLVPLTEIQVLSPTWYIHVSLDQNGEHHETDYFVNAVDGTIVDIEQNAKEKELQKQ
ncbi:two-component system regulatory protein YycI [Rummeliibacillus sp. JY-2-4R]